jgi:uncharacterized protein (TIGR02246 family)
MRNALFALPCGLLLALALVSNGPPAAAQGAAKDAAILAVADAYTKASLAGDVKAIAALYTDDGIELPPNHGPVKGRAAIEAFYTEQMRAAKLTAFSLEHWESRVGADVAFDVGAYRQALQPAEGAAMKDTGKYAVILKKVGGQWKVAYAIYNSDQPMPMPGQK